MHRHIEPKLFLAFDHQRDLFAHARFVIRRVQFAPLEVAAGRTDFLCLREGADRGRREQRQIQSLTLCRAPNRIDAGATRVGIADLR